MIKFLHFVFMALPCCLYANPSQTAKNEALHSALYGIIGDINSSHLISIEQALKNGGNPNFTQEGSYTPLTGTMFRGFLPLVQLLVKYGADVNGADQKSGTTPLMSVPSKSNRTPEEAIEITRFLLKQGAKVDLRDKEGNTALHWMVRFNHVKAIPILIQAGADLEAKNRFGETPLIKAAKESSREVIEILASSGARVEEALLIATRYKRPEAEAALINFVPKGSEGGKSLTKNLFDAIESKNTEAVVRLLTAGADPNARNKEEETPLMSAARTDELAIVELLLNKKADVALTNKDKETALFYATKDRSLPLFNRLVALGDINHRNRHGRTVLVSAASANQEEIVAAILKRKPDLKDRYTGNWRAIHESSEKGYSAITALLLTHGMDSNFSDDFQMTPLMLAARRGHVPDMKLLLDKGAKTENQNTRTECDHGCDRGFDGYDCGFGGTALMWASLYGNLEAVELLLSRGSKIDAVNELGVNALMIAVESGHKEVEQRLIKAGANPNLKDKQGNSIQYYREHPHPKNPRNIK